VTVRQGVRAQNGCVGEGGYIQGRAKEGQPALAAADKSRKPNIQQHRPSARLAAQEHTDLSACTQVAYWVCLKAYGSSM
jgi:hypothetical protein